MLEYLIKAVEKNIVELGSNVQGSKERINEIITSEKSKPDKIKALKEEYGTGGSSVTLAIYDTGMRSWDNKGIKYIFYDLECKGYIEEEILFSWPQVLKLFEECEG